MQTDKLGVSSLAAVLYTACIGAFLYVFFKGWRARSAFVKLRKQGMPMPPHSLIFGHLLAIKKVLDSLPTGIHMVVTFGSISRKFPKSGFCYLDLWPFGVPFMIVTSPTMAIQATQQSDLMLLRPEELKPWFAPLTGGESLFDMSVEAWKPWRAMFNLGFSAANLLTHVPGLVEETLVYREILAEHAKKGDVFQLDKITLRFTMDLIGRSVLNTRLNSQKGWNPLADALLSQISWHGSNEEVNPWQRWHPLRPFVEWYNSRQMNRFIGDELQKRWKLYQEKNDEEFSTSIMDLAIRSFIESQPSGSPKPEKLDKDFVKVATSQIRLFLFAGHDTTSSSIVYCFHMLARNPTALKLIREEHELVFGSDSSQIPSKISSKPHILNNLPYTTAIIKETMRLYPGASGIRAGAPGVDLVDDDGNRYPTEGTNIWIIHHGLHRNPKYWKRADEFIPERWLVGPEHELYPVKGAWRPFEHGPRNCIGQGLVMLEIKTVLAVVLATLDISPAYDEWDKMHPSKGIEMVDNDRAYQIEKCGAHPAEMYPCKVAFKK
ncbi:hypothetical protein HYFRA_00001366 [Hymenoscyphus fraxineus]|uniref:Cytochrome P450 n=1 Tax=Hymenoscyphus fraxineus TaxID=746836 RepID=A0A9N9PY18_9HELO|nr:hypothetical protein HYFRA_00001366 [Hymenoscyphus fraxineus]